MSLRILGHVVLGVLLQVAELARRLDARGHLVPRRRLELVQLGAQRLEALGRDRLAGRLARAHAAAPAFERRASLARAPLSSSALRRRTFAGVTSTHSSSRRNSSAWSSDRRRAGTRRTSTSAVEERMFVRCFSLTAFTSRSSARAFSPTIIPS